MAVVAVLFCCSPSFAYTRGRGVLTDKEQTAQAKTLLEILNEYQRENNRCVSLEDKVGYGGLWNLKDEEGSHHMNPPRSGFETALYNRLKEYIAKNRGSRIGLDDFFRMGLEACTGSDGSVNMGDVLLSLHNVTRLLARPENWSQSDPDKPGWRKIRDVGDPGWNIIQDLCGVSSSGGDRTLAEIAGINRMSDVANLSPEKAEKIRIIQEKRRKRLEGEEARLAFVTGRIDALRRSIPMTPYATSLPESVRAIVAEIEALSKERVTLEYRIEDLRWNPLNNLVDTQVGYSLFDPANGIFKPLPGAEEWVGNGGAHYYFWLGSLINLTGGGKSAFAASIYERMQKYLGSEEEYARGLIQLSYFASGSKLGKDAYASGKICDLIKSLGSAPTTGARPAPGAQGGPGGDNPDDNENIGAALLSLSPSPRAFFALCAAKDPGLLRLFAGDAPWDESPLARALDAGILGTWAERAYSSAAVSGDAASRSAEARLALVPDVAVLDEGCAAGVVSLLSRAGEPSVLLSARAPLALLSKYPVLVIPSGTLSEWSASASFRKRLEDYVSGGGRILAFAQQLGRHFAALPGSPSAYGWAEDQSCQFGSVAITAPVAAFASQTREKPDLNVDGYFLDYPPEAEVLLARTKNDQPCLISYTVGRGSVTASTLYPDWAAANHQGTADEARLVRDLVAQLVSGARSERPVSLPTGGKATFERELRPADIASGDIALALLPEVLLAPQTSPDLRERFIEEESRFLRESGDATTARLVLLDPEGNLVEGAPFSCDLRPGIARTVRMETPPLKTPGFYRGFVELSNAAGTPLESLSLGRAAVAGSLPAMTETRRDLSFSVQSDLENYVRGATGRFSLIVWNRGPVPRKIRADYRLPHNLARAAEPSQYRGSVTMDVLPGKRRRHDFSCPIVNEDGVDRLWATFFDAETGENLGTWSKGFFTRQASAPVTVESARQDAEAGGFADIVVRVGNPFGNASTGRISYSVTDASGASFTLAERDVAFTPEGYSGSERLLLPERMYSGTVVIQAVAEVGGTMVGIGGTSVEFVGRPVPFSGRVMDRLSKKGIPGATVAFHFGSRLFETTTDGGGGFSLALPGAVYGVEVRADGYNRSALEHPVSPEANAPLDIRLLPEGAGVGAGTVAGTCRDRVLGDAIGGADVRFEGGGETYDVRSDGAGRYAAALPPGDYAAVIWRDGMPMSDRFPVRVTDGWRQNVDLYGAVGKFSLRIRDLLSEESLDDVRVGILRPGDEASLRDVSVLAARGGEVHIPGSGRRVLRLSREGYEPLQTEIFVNERPGTFEFFLKPRTAPLEIVVRDLLTDGVVEGATVGLERPDGTAALRGVTGRDGRVTLAPEGGRLVLTIGRDGSLPVKTELFAGPRGGGSGEYWMRPATTLRVFEARDVRDDLPLAGVRVRVARPDGSEPREGTTDVSGRFSTALPDGRWTLRMKKEKFALLETDAWISAATRAVEERRGAETYYLYPDPAAPQGTLTLTVRDEYGDEPLADVAVSMRHAGGQETSGRTDASGRLDAALPDGRVAFRLKRDGYDPLETDLFVCHRGASGASLWLAPSRAERTFLLKDHLDDTPLADVEIVAVERDAVTALGRTDGAGALAIALPGGRRTFRFSLKGYETLETDFLLTPGPAGREEPETVYLAPRTRSFRGRVQDSSGTALPGVSVTATWGKEQVAGLSGPDGIFALDLPRGVGELAFTAPGFEGRRLQVYWGLRGGETPTFTILRAGEKPSGEGDLRISVLDALTGAPLPSFSAHLGDLAWQEIAGPVANVRFPAGEKGYLVRAPGYAETGWFQESTLPGTVQERSIALAPATGVVRFRVRDAFTGQPLPRFTANPLDTGWREWQDGTMIVRQEGQNRNTFVKADGYVETGWFAQRAFPGRVVDRTVALRPFTGALCFRVRDAVTGLPLPRFTANLVDTGWREGQDGTMLVRQDGQNRNTLVKAEGYVETGWFAPRAWPGRAVEHVVDLWPATGTISLDVADALTGRPLPRFTANPVDTGWREGEDGTMIVRQDGQNRNTLVKADGYVETGWFAPRAFPGRSVRRVVALWPSLGDVTLSAVDAVTGRPLPRFAANLVDTRERGSFGGALDARQDGQNRNTFVRAEGYAETGWFLQAAVPGKRIRRTVALWPVFGEYGVRVRDALTGAPLPAFTAHLLDRGWTDVAGDVLAVSQDRNARNTIVRAAGHRETGSYYPAATPGKRIVHPVDLFPVAPGGRVTVRAEDLVTGRVVPGAEIAVPDGGKLRADASGTAVWDGAGDFVPLTFAAEAPGYSGNRMPSFLTTGQKGISVTIPLEERIGAGKGSLRIAVRGAGDAPVAGARVSLRKGDVRLEALAGAGGTVISGDLDAGVWIAAAEAPGYLSRSVRASVRPSAATALRIDLVPLSATRRPTPFAPEIVSAPRDVALRRGEKTPLSVVLRNGGDVTGRASCVLDLPSVYRESRKLVLAPGEMREIRFDAATPADAPASVFRYSVTFGGAVRTGAAAVKASGYRVVASTDKAAYREGDLLDLTARITAVADGEAAAAHETLLFRATFNDEVRRREVTLRNGEGETTVAGIPVAFRGNRLLYGLYDPSGTALVLDALQVLPESSLDIAPDRRRYAAGDEVRLTIRGEAGRTVRLESPLWEDGRDVALSADGTGRTAFVLPPDTLTGSYPVSGGGTVVAVDVRGMEMKILDRRMERDDDAVRLVWSARSLGVRRCGWSVSLARSGGTPGKEVASGDVDIPQDGADAAVVFRPAGESAGGEGYVLTLSAPGKRGALAVVRYFED
jgi:hypothetical protein